MTRRAGLTPASRRFDLSWFIGAILKYRHLLGEVWSPRFSALVSPLFFQVVIDKVLFHRGISTLDVLVIGLVAMSLFESSLRRFGLMFSRTLQTGSTSSLARGCSRHLIALPIGYFEARRTGDSVARVRELENIRNFLTSSALTLVIDLFFTLCFSR